MKKNFSLLLIIFLLINNFAAAQTFSKVKDISTGTANSLDGSEPPVAIGNISFFCATDGITGYELWKTDGTAAGTVMVKDIFAGVGDAYPGNMINVAGIVYFFADDGINGNELWKSDGTLAGTVMIKDIKAGANSSYPCNFFRWNNILFFAADDGINGVELWKSDGTAAGTVLVKDMNSGTGDGYPKSFAIANNTLFFSATDAVNGNELWKSDGSSAGTVMVKDIEAGVVGSSISNIVAMGNNIYFQAFTYALGFELYKSDGTTAGTVLIKDINSCGSCTAGIYNNADIVGMVVFNNALYFRANDGTTGNELWKTDGTAAGTVIIKDINSAGYGGFPYNLTVVNNTLFFAANNGTNGYELWKSNGSIGNAAQVTDIENGSNGSYPKFLTNVNGKLYFVAATTIDGDEVFTSDGTTTNIVGNINAGATGSGAQFLVNNNQKLFLQASETATGNELWSYNNCSNYSLATTGSTSIADIEQGNNFIKSNTCQLIASIKQSGSNALYNAVTAKVTIDASVQSYLSKAYVQRHYDIEPVSNAANASATVTLYFLQSEFNAYNAANGTEPDLPTGPGDVAGITNLGVTQYHGTGTLPGNYSGTAVSFHPANSQITWNATDNRWEVRFSVTGFSGFYIAGGTGLTVLASTNIIMDAAAINEKTNNINWQVNNEQSIQYYAVEKSTNGISFYSTKTIYVNSNASGMYNFTDEDAAVTTFYRIRATRQNSIAYSDIKKVIKKTGAKTILYPTVAQNFITVSSTDAAVLYSPAFIIDYNGQIVKTILHVNAMQQINISDITSGMYFLKFANGQVHKFIKQ